MSNGDVHIVAGLDAIVNPDNVKPGVDLKELERRMISGGLIKQTIKDPQDRFNDELNDAAKKLGISFGEFGARKSEPKYSQSAQSNQYSQPQQPSHYSQPSSFQSSSFQSKSSLPNISIDENSEEESEHSESEDESQDDDDTHGGNSANSTNYTTSNNFSAFNTNGVSSPRNRFSDNDRPKFSTDFRVRTQEQERRSHIDAVMGGADSSSFSFEKEKREDMKCAMLAEIDLLLEALADEDIDTTRIPKVDQHSPYEEVESVLRILRHKNDHVRYRSFAEEFILFGAYGLEELFDGKRMWFGRYSPDLTGWHNQVNVKLKRMRHDTGQLMSGVMQDYNIGPGARVLLELVPNMVLYSKMRKQQHDDPGLFSDAEMQNAKNSIREFSN